MNVPGVSAIADDVDEKREGAVGVSPPVPVQREAWGGYLVALVLYVALSVGSLSLRDNVVLLNWLIGPLFPIFVLYVVPTGVKAAAKRWRSR
jgi:hypothetical protein